MSTTAEKRTHEQAYADALAFAKMFPPSAYVDWLLGGSIRRNKPHVGDVEHVVIPGFGEVQDGDGGLFAAKKKANLVWHTLDNLVADGTVAKAIYGATGPRWGDKYRGVLFRGFKHEIFTATPESFGAQLAIRTGPAEFSEHLVTSLRRNGYRMVGGFVRIGADADETAEIVPVPDEETFFKLCGVAYIKPESR